jgi:hypothetical protein
MEIEAGGVDMPVPPPEGKGDKPLVGRFVTVLAILLGLSLSVSPDSFFPLARSLQLSSDLVNRSEKYKGLKASNDAIEGEVRFRGRPEGRKSKLRENGQVSPGQHKAHIVETPPAARGPLTRSQRVQGWISTTEEHVGHALSDFWEMWRCYAGLRPLDQPSGARNQNAVPLSNQAKPARPAAPKVAPNGT